MYDKAAKMSPNHRSHMRMHYATMVALAISNITTLGLALLFSNQVLGGGLANIAYYGEMRKVEAAQLQYRTPDEGGDTYQGPGKRGGGGGGVSVPAAPKYLRGTILADPAAVALTWDDMSTSESGFVIERGVSLLNTTTPTSSIAFAEIGRIPANSTAYGFYRDAGPFQEYRTYWYRVKAYNSAGSSAYTNATTFDFTDLTSPSIPQNVRQTSATCSGLSLAWDASQDKVDGSGVWGYKIYQDGEYARNVYLATSDSSSGGFIAFSSHTFQVAAFDYKFNVSGLSQQITISRPLACPPVTPRNTAFTAIKSNSISLKWDDASNNENYFQISRSDIIPMYREIGRATANVTTYTDTTVRPGQRYCYVVRAYNGYGPSAGYSQEICETTPAAPDGAHSCVFKPYDGQNYVTELSHEATVATQAECLSLAETWKQQACATRIYTNYLFYDYAQIHIGSGDCCCVSNNSCVFCSQ